ncbi:MAG TPA: metallophosphoesterase, partial [Dongiaceae bacterium]|nr:metallophosphoesterase [Dongiaceae bacterium]
IGGDLAPHGSGEQGVRMQRIFLQGFLVEFARRLHESNPGVELLLMMGNDDWAANLDCLEAHEGRLWRMLHERVVRVDGVAVAGVSWVPITPFTMKDWERWDDGEPERAARLDGWVSRGRGLVPHRFDPDHRAPTIAASLAELATRTVPADTVFVSHGPPHGTRCDMIGAGAHVGSRALRRFVERFQPPLVLGGHIHESPRVSSSYRDTIGRTVVVNPGQFGTADVCGVWFDPRHPAETLRHTVFDA